jgi:hypothetical protein
MTKAYFFNEHYNIVHETENPKTWENTPGYKRISASEGKALLKKNALEYVKPYFTRDGARIYTIIRSVSASGMSRAMDFYAISDNDLIWLTGSFATILGGRRSKAGALIVNGCGMDMSFATIDNVAYHFDKTGNDVRNHIL